jgi:photosystem II stability/assembly factor-like uncharacterized protein
MKTAMRRLGRQWVCLLLAACGGSGGGPGIDNPPTQPSLTAGLACSGPAQSGWCWQRPQPWGNRVNDVRFVDARNGWAVGEAGLVLKTTDGGGTWRRVRQDTGIEASLHQVRFADASHGWALGWDGALLRTADGGESWAAVAAGLPPGLWTRLWVLDRSRIVIAGSPNGIPAAAFVSDDGGARWRYSEIAPDEVTPGGTMWTFNVDTVRRSTDLGRTWVRFDDLAGFGRGMVFGDHHVVVFRRHGDSAVVHTSRDGGASWRAEAAPNVGGGAVVAPRYLSAEGRGWGAAVSADDGRVSLHRTMDDGRTWTPLSLATAPPGLQLFDDAALDDQILWGNVDGATWLSDDAGRSWRPLRAGGAPAAPSFDGGGGLVLDSGAQKFRSTDAGRTAQLVPGGRAAGTPPQEFMGLWFFDAQRGLAMTIEGQLWDSPDGGRSWAARAELEADCGDAADLHFIDASRGWLRKCGRAWRSIDGGHNWAPLPNAPADIVKLQFVDPLLGFAVSQRFSPRLGPRPDFTCTGALQVTRDGGNSWADVPTQFGSSCQTMAFGPGGAALAIAADGGFWRSADAGATWSAIAAPGGAPRQAARAHFLDARNAWIADTDRGILRSNDGGATWVAGNVPPLTTGNWFQAVRFVDASNGWAVGGSGLVLATRDGGITWTRQPTGSAASLQAVFALDANTVWAAGLEGRVLVSTSGGR